MARAMRGDELPSRREGFLEAMLGAVADAPVYVYDGDLRVVECFWARPEHPWGVDPRELVGRCVGEFLDPEEAGPFERALREVFESGRWQSFECAFGLPVGRVWFDVRLAPIRGPRGEVDHVLAASYDLTERRRAAQALFESEHRYQSLAEAVPVGVWRNDPARNFVYANRRVWELLGVDPDDPENRDLAGLLEALTARGHLSSSESDRLWREAERAVQGEEANVSRLAIRLTDGSLRHLRTLALPERDSSGNFVGHVGVTIDVTDLERAQQELLRHRDHLGELVAERTLELERSHEAFRRGERLAAVGTFAAGIAHQINNPVGSILLAAQFAQEDVGNRDRVEAALADIVADARRCGRIVRGVLEFAQGPTAEPRPCDLNQIARDCVRRLAPEAAERGAALRVELDAQLPPAAGSDAALDQVIANLVTNSLEAAAREIVVATHARDGAVVLVVRDDGCGIEGENLDRIFDPLFTTRATRGGTGLGLALARGVIEAHGGSIEVSSRGGEGTEVSVRLPRARSGGA